MHPCEGWKESIAEARDAEAMAQALRTYVAAIAPADIAMLPASCREVLAHPAKDIHGAAVTLLHEALRLPGDVRCAHLLQELSEAFGAAAARLGQIEAHSQIPLDPDGDALPQLLRASSEG